MHVCPVVHPWSWSAEHMAPVVFHAGVLRLVCVSDLHNDNPTERVPDGDIFVCAGDLTDHGSYDELAAAFEWLVALSHPVKVVVAGRCSTRF